MIRMVCFRGCSLGISKFDDLTLRSKRSGEGIDRLGGSLMCNNESRASSDQISFGICHPEEGPV